MRVWKGLDFAVRARGALCVWGLALSCSLHLVWTPNAEAQEAPLEPGFVNTLVNYQGPLRIFVFDIDGNVTPIQGEGSRPIRVFLWNEYTSPLSDPSRQSTPRYIDIPLSDWERGVESKVRAYHRTPLKYLFGHYESANPGSPHNVRTPGNSFQDEKIKLSNGIELNPRDYYLDPVRSFEQFRTQPESTPLVDAVKAMAASGNFGPMFPVFKLASDPNFPVMTMALTMGGNSGIEWSIATDHLIESGHLAPGSAFDRVFALTNPSLQTHDEASVSQYLRAETPSAKRKSVILEYLIDYVLSRRIDRTNGAFPLPNVLTYFEDTPSLVASAADLFERKIRGIRSTDGRGGVGSPPLKLILANTAPLSQYQALHPAQTANPQALSAGTQTLASVMVFRSDFILGLKPMIERINKKNLEGVAVEALKQTFDVSEKTVKAVLNGEAPCSALLSKE